VDDEKDRRDASAADAHADDPDWEIKEHIQRLKEQAAAKWEKSLYKLERVQLGKSGKYPSRYPSPLRSPW
jgi:hypothetical protein